MLTNGQSEDASMKKVATTHLKVKMPPTRVIDKKRHWILKADYLLDL